MLAPLFAVAVMVAVPTLEPSVASTTCTASIAVYFGNGSSFDGMSQSGDFLVLRNSGSADCLMPGLPKLQFDDAAGHRLDVLREPPPGMHPGPAVTPIVLSPGTQAIAALTWVSGDVYGGHHCITPAKVGVGEDSDAPIAIWRFGQLCGEPGKPILFRQAVLRLRPIPPP